MRLLLPAFLPFLIALFVMGVVVPRRSRSVQAGVERRLARLEHWGDRSAGRLRDVTATGLRRIRKVTGASAKADRATRNKSASG